MAEKALTDKEASEGDVICAPKLLGIILQNCRGRVDHCVAHFVTLVLNRHVFSRAFRKQAAAAARW